MVERSGSFICTDIRGFSPVPLCLTSQLLCSGSAGPLSECLRLLPFLTSSWPKSVVITKDLVDVSIAISSFETVPRMLHLLVAGSCRQTLSPDLKTSWLKQPLLLATVTGSRSFSGLSLQFYTPCQTGWGDGHGSSSQRSRREVLPLSQVLSYC